MKNIILFYEHINREYNACLQLKEELEKKGDVKVYLFEIIFEYFKAIKISKNTKIDMIIMPWIYHENDYEYVQPFIKNNRKIYIVNLHHEQIGSEVSYRILLPNGSAAKNSTIHFVWGDNFKKKLIENGVEEDLIFTTGNIRSDNLFNTQKNKKSLSKEYNLDIKKKWILFSENRGWVLNINNAMYNDLIYKGFTEDELEEYIEVSRESLESTIKEFEALGDEFFSKFELIYRPHPGTQAPKMNNKIKIIDKYSIYEWIRHIDINVVWSSTTIFESDINNVPSFVYEPLENPEKFKTDGIEKYTKISNIIDLLNEELVIESQKYQSEMKIFEEYIGIVDGKRNEFMSEVIVKILENGINCYNVSEEKYSKYRYYKKFFFEVITKVFVSLNILEKLKYPKTAYSLKKDIPYNKIREK